MSELQALYDGQHISDGLVGWWPLNDGFGDTAQDLSGNDNHGTLVNGPGWVEPLSPMAGAPGAPGRIANHVEAASLDATRIGEYNRRAAVHTASIGYMTGGAGAHQRDVAHYGANASIGMAREASYRRVPGYTADSLATGVQRIIDVSRAASVYADSAMSDISREIALSRSLSASARRTDISVSSAVQYARSLQASTSPVRWSTSTAIPHWIIDGRQVPGLQEEIRDWESLTLQFESTSSVVDSVLRPLESDAAKYEIVPMGDGGYIAVDRTTDGETNTVTLRPPAEKGELRTIEQGLVSSYGDVTLDQRGEEYEVEVEFVASENVEPETDEYDRIDDEDDLWHFEFAVGDILTRRVSYEIAVGSIEGVETKGITMVLDLEETRVVERSATQLNSVFVQEIPDGEDRVRDESFDGVHEVSISPPEGSGVAFEGGDYVVVDWTSEWIDGGYYEVTIEVVRAS